MIKSLCRDCQKKKAPARWFKDVEIMRIEISKVGGSLRSVQYVCPDCNQILIYKTLTVGYFLVTGVN